MTDYEFEYEFLQDAAYRQWLEDIANKDTPIDVNSNTFDRQFRMDEAEYDHIRDLADVGEFIDFEIPKDAPQGRTYSDIVMGKEEASKVDDFVPVDLSREFGGDLGG